AVAGPSALAAQVVNGTVSDDMGTPLRGAFVMLLNADGRQLAAVLAGERGEFIFRVSAGRYSLRADLIGHRTATAGPFEVGAGQTVTQPLRLQVAALQIPEISVTAGKRCTGRPESSRRTAEVWEEARKALTVAAWVSNSGPAIFRVRNYERDTDLALQDLAPPKTEFALTAGKRAYYAIDPDSLAQFGYVQTKDGERIVFGPDAELLLSNSFLTQHCFDLRRERDRPGLIGLAFEPLAERKLPDIEGVLWLDATTGELRFIEYGYTNVPNYTDRRYAGGRTEFERLPNGAWIVRRWYVRAPRLGRNESEVRVLGARETGGEVLDVQLAGRDPATMVARVTIEGSVFDSISGRALAGARVYLSGTPFSATTAADGQFRMDSIPAGEYYITFSHPRLDSLPTYPAPQKLSLGVSGAKLSLAVPPAERLIAQLCEDDEWDKAQRLSGDTLSTNRGAFYGTINSTIGPLSDAQVDVRWSRFAIVGAQVFRANELERARMRLFRMGVDTGEDGAFAVCRLPLDRPVIVEISRRDMILARDTIRFQPHGLYRRDYFIRR
ncbi:MAG TPA: carboxypeptidase-like regulatory domain-containing protein, partial [Longimicrobiales bacterium]|nr:carboxypeptidase-like regulatory domain-containing protein [Longimicrobiales bacterium]